jgi:hypothetical protein
MYVADVNLCAVFKYPSCGTVYPTVFAGVSGTCSGGTSYLSQPEGAFLDNLSNLYVVSLTKEKWLIEQVEIRDCHRQKDRKAPENEDRLNIIHFKISEG